VDSENNFALRHLVFAVFGNLEWICNVY